MKYQMKQAGTQEVGTRSYQHSNFTHYLYRHEAGRSWVEPFTSWEALVNKLGRTPLDVEWGTLTPVSPD
jgi:hypothetical protein